MRKHRNARSFAAQRAGRRPDGLANRAWRRSQPMAAAINDAIVIRRCAADLIPGYVR